MADKVPGKLTTGLVRFSYANVFTPRDNDRGEKEYSVAILVPKKDKDGLKYVNAAIKEAVAEARSSGKLPKNVKLIKVGKHDYPIDSDNFLRDGDLEKPGDEAYMGMMFFNAKSSKQPNVVDKSLKAIIDPADFYSGCWGRVSVKFYFYDNQGGKGIGCGLNNIQKLKDDTALAGGSTPEDDFAEALEVDEDEF